MRFEFANPSDRARGIFLGLLLIVIASALATPIYAQVDLTVSCTQTLPADPNLFVDGDTISLDCTASNSGPGATGGTGAVAYLSANTVVESSDTLIGQRNIPGVAGGGTTSFNITGAPSFSIPGLYNICVKVDALPGNLGGTIIESDEANNTFCRPIQVLFAQRDLTVPNPPTVLGPTTDPNTVHAGSLIEVMFTVTNAGNAIVRDHVNAVRLSTDSVIDGSDPILCELPEIFLGGSVVQGLLGGQSETRSFGRDPNAPTAQMCKLSFTQTPGTYFIGIDSDPNGVIFETDPNFNLLDGNNTNSVSVSIALPFPATLIAADPNVSLDTQQELAAPGKAKAFFSVFSALDLAAYGFTLTWSPSSLITIADPNDVVAESAFLGQNGRVGSCSPPVINNPAGTVAVSCTSTGSAPGANLEFPTLLLSINFDTVAPGSGGLIFSAVTGSDSAGSPVSFNVGSGTFVVSGPPDMFFKNLTSSPEAFPGTDFTTSFDICNRGFSSSPAGVTTLVQVSTDATVTAADPVVCSVKESAPLPALDCGGRSNSNCLIVGDPRPGDYTVGITIDPNTQTPQAAQALPLPPRVFALRAHGKGQSIESTRAPDGLGGTVGATLASDSSFKPRSITSVRTVLRNFNLVAGYLKPSKGQKAGLYRTPRFLNTDLDAQSTSILRLPTGTLAVLGGADINKDGEDELILLKKGNGGQFLDFRLIDFAKRRPEIGISIAVTAPFVGNVVGAQGIQFDADAEDEVAVVTDDGTTQALAIYDVGIVDPSLGPSTLTAVADDLNFGTTTAAVQGICVIDFALDGTPLLPDEEIVALTVDSSGTQALKVFDPPAGPSGQAVLVADDPAYGGVTARAKVLSIGCTR